MKVETTQERILEAASKCSKAKQTLKTLFPEVFTNTYKHGMFFKRRNEIAILAQVERSKCAFICLNDGNRYSDPVKVNDVMNITEQEIQIMSGCNGQFELIDTPKIVF